MFHDTELRKMSEGGTLPQTEASLATALRHFSHGYGTVLSLISQVSGSDNGSGTPSTMEELASSGDEDLDDILPMSSSLSITERMKVISLSGIIPMNGSTIPTASYYLLNECEIPMLIFTRDMLKKKRKERNAM